MLSVSSLMECCDVKLPVNTGVSEAAGLLRNRDLKRAPVVDRKGQFRGIVERKALEMAEHQLRDESDEGFVLDWEMIPNLPPDVNQLDTLTHHRCTIAGPEESVADIAARMLQEGTDLVIVTREGEILGTLEIHELLKVFTGGETEDESND